MHSQLDSWQGIMVLSSCVHLSVSVSAILPSGLIKWVLFDFSIYLCNLQSHNSQLGDLFQVSVTQFI